MSVYADSSFILALYHADALNSRAVAYMDRHGAPMILTAIQEAEVRNSFRLQVAQKRSSSEKAFQAMSYFNRDISDGIFVNHRPDWTELFRTFERISQKYTEIDAHRFPDILHIACALTLQAKVFLSFDQKQSGLAKTLGFKTPL